jgi:hypothetical protein
MDFVIFSWEGAPQYFGIFNLKNVVLGFFTGKIREIVSLRRLKIERILDMKKWQIIVTLSIVWDLTVLSNLQQSDAISLINFMMLIPLVLFWMYCLYVVFFIDWEAFYERNTWAFVVLSPCVLYMYAHGLAFVLSIFFLVKSVFD